MTQFSPLTLTLDDEQRLRDLASGLAKGIEDPKLLIARLGFTPNEYQELSDTRTFKSILGAAVQEWAGASNTHKRIKLKAAVNIEEALPHFYKAMTNDKEPLSSKVKAFEAVMRAAGVGNPEPLAAGAGQFFKLEINLGGGVVPIVLEAGVEDVTLEHEEVIYSQSKVFDALPLEDME